MSTKSLVQLGCTSCRCIACSTAPSRGKRRPAKWAPAPGRLTLADREEITIGLSRGERFIAIALRLSRSVSTVSREVAANGGRVPMGLVGELRAQERGSATKAVQAEYLSPLAQAGRGMAQRVGWPPEEIAVRLRQEFPDDPMMRVSHETIYQSLFVQGRGELRRELTPLSAQWSHRSQTTGKPEKRHPDPEHGHDQRSSG